VQRKTAFRLLPLLRQASLTIRHSAPIRIGDSADRACIPQDNNRRLIVYHKFLGRHVVVRTYSAGVHIGTLTEIEGQAVVLTNARRLWKWDGAFTLSEVAIAGIKPKSSRMAVAVPEILLTQAVEIIPTTETARSTFDATYE
jgi:hypothetical protein